MSWSAGTYTRTNTTYSGATVWAQDEAAAFDILSTRHDLHDQDLASGINACLNKNGQNAMTADLAMGANKLTGLADGTATTDGVALQQLTAIISRKNYLINPRGQINQRGVSGSVVLAAGIYGHDRFKGGSAGCSYTFAVVDGTTTFTITAGSLIQVIEGNTLPSGSMALGWTGTAQAQIDGGGYAVAPVTATATGGTDMDVEWGIGTVSFPQVETGTAATAFEYRPVGDEFALCQRYYWRGRSAQRGYYYGETGITLMVGATVTYPVAMRVTPTVLTIETAPTYSNCTHHQLQGIADGFTHQVTVTADGRFRAYAGEYSAEAEL